jgi:hypothetical protein
VELWVSLGSPRPRALPVASVNGTKSTLRICLAIHVLPNEVSTLASSPLSTTIVAFLRKSHNSRWPTRLDTILALLMIIPAIVVLEAKMVSQETHSKLSSQDKSAHAIVLLTMSSNID